MCYCYRRRRKHSSTYAHLANCIAGHSGFGTMHFDNVDNSILLTQFFHRLSAHNVCQNGIRKFGSARNNVLMASGLGSRQCLNCSHNLSAALTLSIYIFKLHSSILYRLSKCRPYAIFMCEIANILVSKNSLG